MARRGKINKGKLGTVISCFILILCLIGLFFVVPMMKKEQAAMNTEATTAANDVKTGKAANELEPSSKQQASDNQSNQQPTKPPTSERVTVKGEVDNWAGWFSLFAANLGNTTSPESKFGQSGLDVTITPVNSDEEKLQHLINGDIDFTACTINRLALISGELSAADTAIVVPLFTDSSNGGDAIVARSQFTSIESLKDATIGVGEGSVSHSVIGWALQQTDMSTADKNKIIGNISTYPSAADAKNAYLRDEINATATWQPYIDELVLAGDTNVILSTKNSSTLVMDALFFRKDFADAHPEVVEAMVDGMLQVVEDMKNGKDVSKYCEVFRNSLPDFSSSSDDEILSMLEESELLDWHQNVDAFNGTANSMFKDMCLVWNSIGYETYSDYGDKIFDASYIKNLSSKYENTSHKESSSTVITDEVRERMQDNSNALLTKTFSVQFVPQSFTEFTDNAEAKKALDDFIKIAKVLDGTMIHITGHVSSRDTTPVQMQLSENRASYIKDYIVQNGIAESRIFAEGKGGYEPIFPDPQDTSEYEANRRVVMSFYTDIEDQ